MTRKHPVIRCGGFTLMEMVVAIMLLGVALTFAAHLFAQTHVLNKRVRQATENLARYEAIINVMRRDAWSGKLLRVDDKHTLRIHRSADQTVTTWAVDDQGVLSRTVQQAERILEESSWADMGWQPTFEADSAAAVVVHVYVDERALTPVGRATLVSSWVVVEGFGP